MITNGYTTLADVKTLLRITSADIADDSVIERMVENASRLFDRETNRRFYTSTSDETRVFTASSEEEVRTDDIISITSVKIDQDYDRVYEITLTASEYDTLPDNASMRGVPITSLATVPLPSVVFPTQTKGVQIVGKFGYSASAPADVKMAVEEIVVSVYKKRFGENTSGAATITGAGVVITPKDIPDTAARTIANYRKHL
jgi:hypothetical protein